MITIRATSIDEALYAACTHLRGRQKAGPLPSRNGDVIELSEPVATQYLNPINRCLFIDERDWNPYFALFEALWILAGRDDVAFLNRFNRNMVDFSDDGKTFNAPYGYRLRRHFGVDQLAETVRTLQKHHESRHAVALIWSPNHDLPGLNDTLDRPCNDILFFKIRNGKLLLTVCCRSNDAIFGAYNVNHFQFSMIQEYVAGCLGIPMGQYHQISDSLHAYVDAPFFKEVVENSNWLPSNSYEYGLVEAKPMFLDCTAEEWEEDLLTFFKAYDRRFNQDRNQQCTDEIVNQEYNSYFFSKIVAPMYLSHYHHKYSGDTNEAFRVAGLIGASDYRRACENWLLRRMSK